MLKGKIQVAAYTGEPRLFRKRGISRPEGRRSDYGHLIVGSEMGNDLKYLTTSLLNKQVLPSKQDVVRKTDAPPQVLGGPHHNRQS